MAGGAPPKRKLRVLFLGAGASKSAGLPLTEELMQHIWPRDHEVVDVWQMCRTRTAWRRDLEKAVTVLYPDGSGNGYRPPVSEFFTLLEVIDRVHAGRERIPIATADLLRDLRSEVSQGLGRMGRQASKRIASTPHYFWLKQVRRPHVVVTSNWDNLMEAAAIKAGLSVHLTWPRTTKGTRRDSLGGELVVLKLHGSIDWGSANDPVVQGSSPAWKYDRLDVPIGPPPHRRRTSRLGSEELLRYRSVDAPIPGDRAGSGFRSPLIATMAVGKDSFIRGHIEGVWDDAYWALSRAKNLSIVGYSLPEDDLELRTLLRLTTRQAGKSTLAQELDIEVVNPSPDAHDRARALLGSGISGTFVSAASWRP